MTDFPLYKYSPHDYAAIFSNSTTSYTHSYSFISIAGGGYLTLFKSSWILSNRYIKNS